MAEIETNEKSAVEKANPLARKLQKILENQVENDKETLEALTELSTFFHENTIRNRRNLRGDIERRTLTINQDTFKAFSQVKEALDSVYNEVFLMNQCCKEMASKLSATKTRTHQLMSQMAQFQLENNRLAMEHDIASKAVDALQLSPAELSVLRGSDQPITSEFFAALEKCQQIHHQCKLMLQSGHQITAFEIMEQMALYQEAALERLYRWTQKQCRNVESAEANLLLTQAVSRLQDRPVLLKYVIDEYCNARRSLVVRSFLEALTVGGPHGTPRPIELHAHDPPRYIGDMLAWLHQMTPTEKENVQALLNGCDRSDVSELVTEALSNITEGVCRPLRVRLEQVITSEPGTAVLHTLCGLIRFYCNTIGQVIPNSSLLETLRDIYCQCHRSFLTALDSHVNRLLERIQAPNQDLSPSAGIAQMLTLLRDVLSGGHIVDAEPTDMEDVIKRVVEPLMESVQETASRLPSVDQAAYTLNCLYQIHSSLSLYEFADQRLDQLKVVMDNQLSILNAEQTASLVHNLGLGPVCALLQVQESGEILSNIPGMDPESLHSFLVKFDALLSAPDALQLPQLRLLVSGAHRKSVQRHALESVLSIYRQLYDAVHNPTNGYTYPANLMPRTPEQVKTLLE
nr:EOG090X03SX [Cyclestheria hislopi]